jgi:hypothetical protein
MIFFNWDFILKLWYLFKKNTSDKKKHVFVGKEEEAKAVLIKKTVFSSLSQIIRIVFNIDYHWL